MEANFEYEVVIPSIYVLFGVWCSAVLSFPAFADMPANKTYASGQLHGRIGP